MIIGHVNNIPTMQFFIGISRTTLSEYYMLLLTECVWGFRNNAFDADMIIYESLFFQYRAVAVTIDPPLLQTSLSSRVRANSISQHASNILEFLDMGLLSQEQTVLVRC